MSLDKIWLVKSGFHIKGPFSTKEIIERIKSREFISVDEAVKPFDRWLYLEEQKEFSEIIQSMESVEVDEFIPMGDEDSSQDEIFRSAIEKSKSVNANLMDLNKEVSRTETTDTDKITSSDSDKVYEVEWNNSSKNNANKFIKYFIIFFSVLILFLGSFLSYDFFILSPRIQETEVKKLRFYTDLYFQLGNYAGAKKKYEKIFSIGSVNSSDKFNYALLLIHEGEMIKAQRITNSIKGTKRVLLQSFLKVYDGDFSLALDLIEDSLEKDPNNIEIKINRAFINFKLDRLRLTSSQILELISESYLNSEILILLAQVNFDLWTQTKNISYLVQIESIFEKNISSEDKFYQELLLILSRTYHLQGQAVKRDRTLNKLFDAPPNHTDLFKRNLLLYPNIVSINFLSFLCSDISRSIEDQNLRLAVSAYCSYRDDKLDEAVSFTEEAVQAQPKNPKILALLSYLLKDLGQITEAKVQLDRSLANGSSFLGNYLKAKSCESEGDLLCSIEYWRKIYIENKGSLEAFSGLANYYLRKKDRVRAKEMALKGLSVSQHYKPLLRLENLLGR